MELGRSIWQLLRKEFLLELRMGYAISGILLYLFSTIFIVYSAFRTVKGEVWNALFWIIVLFTAVNAIVKSFVQENGHRQLYFYSLVSPMAVILSKIIYNIVLLSLLSLLTWLGFAFIGGSPIKDTGQFVLALLLGSVGFSITFTFISAISAKANNSATLMAILSFPLVIPILLTLLKLTANALGILQDTGIQRDMLILVAIDLLLLAMTFVLFPFLWRD